MAKSDPKSLVRQSCQLESFGWAQGTLRDRAGSARLRGAQNHTSVSLRHNVPQRCVFRVRLAGYIVGLIACATFFTTAVWAGGAFLYELGTPDLGMAAAGRAALAQDASTVVGNPAGMTRLDRSQLTTTLYAIIPSIKFDRGSGTTPSGGNGFDAGTSIPSSGSASIPIPAGSFFYVYSLSPDWKLGVGVGSGYGAGEIRGMPTPRIDQLARTSHDSEHKA